jgi:hypothetical protein
MLQKIALHNVVHLLIPKRTKGVFSYMHESVFSMSAGKKSCIKYKCIEKKIQMNM